MDHALGERVDLLRQAVKRLVDGGPLRDLELPRAHDEAVEEIRRLPAEIVVVEDASLQERALVDVPRRRRVDGHEAPQDVPIDALDAGIVVRELEMRIERRIAEVLEQGPLVRVVGRQERGDRDGVAADEGGVREMPLEVRILPRTLYHHRRAAVVPHSEVTAIGPPEANENGIGPEGRGRRNLEMPREERITPPET